MAMIGARAQLLSRLVARSGKFCNCPSSYPTLLVRFQSSSLQSLAQKTAETGSRFVPKRSLAGGHSENYILEKNSLTETEKQEIHDSVKKDFEDWIPYGYDPADKENDIYRHKMFLFSSITLGVVVFWYLYWHLPPRNQRDWATREAYLELERRQRLGLPLVDKNVIPPDEIVLPSLEELGDDYELII